MNYQKFFMHTVKSSLILPQINRIHNQLVGSVTKPTYLIKCKCGSSDIAFRNVDYSLPYQPIRLVCSECDKPVHKPKQVYYDVCEEVFNEVVTKIDKDWEVKHFFGHKMDVPNLFKESLKRLKIMITKFEKMKILDTLGVEDLHLRSLKELIEDLEVYSIDLSTLITPYIEEDLPSRVSLLKVKVEQKYEDSVDVVYTSILHPPYSVRSFAESCGFVSSSSRDSDCYQPKDNSITISFESLGKDSIIEAISVKRVKMYNSYKEELAKLITFLFKYRDPLILLFFCKKRKYYKSLIKEYFKLYPKLLELDRELFREL